MVRKNYWQMPERFWTAEEEDDFDNKEREKNYGMTWKEWCNFVETHTNSEVLDFRFNYCMEHGKKWPEGPITKDEGKILNVWSHQNDLGITNPVRVVKNCK